MKICNEINRLLIQQMNCGKAVAVAWIRRHVELSNSGSRVDFVSAFKRRDPVFT